MLTQERVKEVFRYKDGKLYWEKPTASWMRKGHEAGSKTKLGYRYAMVDGHKIMVHWLVWLYHYGFIPDCLDHIDGDTLNNRVENLRLATREQNNQNARLRKDNKSGQKGVRWREDQQKWHVVIKANKKTHHLGYFEDFEQAKTVYLKAAQELHGAFATNRGVNK